MNYHSDDLEDVGAAFAKLYIKYPKVFHILLFIILIAFLKFL